MSDSIFLTNGSGTITRLVDGSYAGELIIPEYVNGERITAIGVEAFRECEFITAVTIPDSVTSIGHDAFVCCYRLTSINIPSSVTNIDDGMFSSCEALTSIIIPDGVTRIGLGAFQNCIGLISINIPDSVTIIDEEAFSSCEALTSINISNSVINIGRWAFDGCTALITVYVDDPNNLSETVSSYDWSGTGSSGITFKKIITSVGVNNLVVNKLTLNQYKTAKNDGLAEDELYIVTDLDHVVDSTIAAAVQASMEIIFANIPTVEGGIF